MGQKGLLDIIGVTHAGMSTEAFEGIVTNWISTVIHPTKTGRITYGLRRQKRVARHQHEGGPSVDLRSVPVSIYRRPPVR